MPQVAFDHSGHEEIAVVIALMNRECERLAAVFRCRFEVVRPQLRFKKRISGADIHQHHVAVSMAIVEQRHGIPGRNVWASVLLPKW